MGLRLFRDRIGRVLTALDEGHNAAELMNIRVFLWFLWLRFGSGGRYLLRRRLFGGQGMLRYLEAVGTGIVPERICVSLLPRSTESRGSALTWEATHNKAMVPITTPKVLISNCWQFKRRSRFWGQPGSRCSDEWLHSTIVLHARRW